jgi:hypothetical protein
MIDDYPIFLTVLVLITSVAGGGIGIALASNPPPVLPGDADLVGETQCTLEDIPEDNVLTDEIVSLEAGGERQFTYAVPNNDSDIEIRTNTLAGMSPTVMFSDPTGSVRLKSVASDMSEEQVEITQAGQYTLTLTNDNEFRSELNLGVFFLQCDN